MKSTLLLVFTLPLLAFAIFAKDDISSGNLEDADLNFTELTTKYGYPTETHKVTTEDGYILTIFRMVKGKNCEGPLKKTPVIIMHGLTTCADVFIFPGPKIGLAYLVSDQCYEVWLGNNRGNKYAQEHVNYTSVPETGEFWNFTYDEHGKYDVKAIVDYVLNTTKSEKVSYIGHSQGTTDFWILTSTRPEYNSKFDIIIALAPVAWLHDTTDTSFRLLGLEGPAMKLALDTGGNRERLSLDSPLRAIYKVVCQIFPEVILDSVLLNVGGTATEINLKTVQISSGHYPQPTSAKNLEHYSQAVNVDKFRMYDYGKEENMKRYGTAEPPDYNVTKVTAPVALIPAKGDLIANLKDVAKLRAKLPNVVFYKEIAEDWGHLHYLASDNISTRLLPTVVELLKKHSS